MLSADRWSSCLVLVFSTAVVRSSSCRSFIWWAFCSSSESPLHVVYDFSSPGATSAPAANTLRRYRCGGLRSPSIRQISLWIFLRMLLGGPSGWRISPARRWLLVQKTSKCCPTEDLHQKFFETFLSAGPRM